jgi:hypothetical protein
MIESIICHVPSLHVGKCLQFMYVMNTVSIFFAGGWWSPVAGVEGRQTKHPRTLHGYFPVEYTVEEFSKIGV